MKTEHFALKLTKEEKEALDFISLKTKTTRSKLIYPAVRAEIERMLGASLIYTLGYMDINDIEEMKAAVRGEGGGALIPRSVKVFCDLVTRETNWSRLRAATGDLLPLKPPEADVLEMYISESLNDIYSEVGRTYLSGNPRFQGIDLEMIRSDLFDLLMYEVVAHTSPMPYRDTMKRYKLNRNRIRMELRRLEREFEKIIGSAPIEVRVDSKGDRENARRKEAPAGRRVKRKHKKEKQ